MTDRFSIFEERRNSNPQGVIDDLVAQTTRQATEIAAIRIEITRLSSLLELAGIDPTAPTPKKTRRKKHENVPQFPNMESSSQS